MANVLRANFVLTWASFKLIEDVVITTVNPNNGDLLPGLLTVTPASMIGIYPGAQLLCGVATGPAPNLELITVLSTTSQTFTAQFANAHDDMDPLQGATFPQGQPDHPVFTQQEMLNYYADTQLDFCLKTRLIYAVATQAIQSGLRIYPTPADSVRLERVSIAGNELWNCAQEDLDFEDPNWQTATVDPNPTRWYQNKVDTGQFGTGRGSPQVGSTAKLFYSQKSGLTSTLIDLLFVPDVFFHYIGYGILAKAWSKDGEQRDDTLAAYAALRFDRGVMVAKKFMEGIIGRIANEQVTVEPLAGVQK